MRVLLIPAYLGDRGQELPSFPLGIAYLRGRLNNHECTAFDPNTVEHPFAELQKSVDKAEPDVIAFSLRNIDTTQSWDVFSYFQQFVATLKLVKQLKPEAKIVVGGTGFSMFAPEIMTRLPEIDYGIFLEGEYAFSELLEKMDRPERVRGLYFRRDGEVLFTGRREPIDFDRLPAPPREFSGLTVEDYKEVAYSIGIQTKRGCAFRCAYCTYPFLQGRSLRLRSPRRVVDEIENLVGQYDLKELFFVDTVFNYPPDHARQIFREMAKRKIRIQWTAWYREDYITKKLMAEAKTSGCNIFEFSPDGASQSTLNILQKDMRLQDVMKTCELASMIGDVKVGYNFMYNVPGENSRTLVDFHKFLFKITTKYWRNLGWIGLTNIRIYPHTEIYRMALRRGLITSKTDLLKPTFYNPPPLNAAYSWVRWARTPLDRLLRAHVKTKAD